MMLEERYDICKDLLETNYVALQKKYHPDNNGGNKDYENKLKIINQAYADLKKSLDKINY